MEEELLKLPPTIPAESLAQVLESLWRTRETGLASPDKARIQSLLNLPTPQHLGPVLACLRSIIRKCVNEKLAGENIQNNQWMAEATKDQPLWQKTRVSDQVKINRPPPFASSTASELSSLLWPREDDATTYPKSSNTPSNVVANLPSLSSMPHNQDHGSLDGLTTLPRQVNDVDHGEKKFSTSKSLGYHYTEAPRLFKVFLWGNRGEVSAFERLTRSYVKIDDTSRRTALEFCRITIGTIGKEAETVTECWTVHPSGS
uniref:Uncharacterized protein n=1 Tax=Ananas comosus var. bracteatus TaxID=296719 RepID=A0A6V7NGE4_ANACO|nr:unnamed protein product [Ananas comosus var. bracteatus]